MASSAASWAGAVNAPPEPGISVCQRLFESWAYAEAAATSMKAALAAQWLKYRADVRLKQQAQENRHSAVPEWKVTGAREAIADWKCGAVPEDDVSLFELMSQLGAALQTLRRIPEAEAARR